MEEANAFEVGVPNVFDDDVAPKAFDVGVPNVFAAAPNGVAAVSKALPPNTLVDGAVAPTLPPNKLFDAVVAAPPNIEFGFCCPKGDC